MSMASEVYEMNQDEIILKQKAEIAELVEQIETTRNVLTVLLVSVDELINKHKGK